MYPSLSITTLFHGIEFKDTPYNLPQNLLDKYDSGAITLHELVNELFNCAVETNKSMNHSPASLPLHSKPLPEESLHGMLAPAEGDHLPICFGMMMTRTNTKERN